MDVRTRFSPVAVVIAAACHRLRAFPVGGRILVAEAAYL